MYNEALVNALNADRQRNYDDLERLRTQREITAQRISENSGTDATPTRGARGRRGLAALTHLGAR
ncbi:hypothetical protein HII28_05990 [Planctomonas sp. JC2975]|uniref:hypothetical protein n=1 Tax=Planctomonas sp. JC2975 TaxID=2729626 RepID=UPI001475F268|nr:hypothetical protein [Planctomonas sp. JC2975]NNC11429.1 hypothetical protein [Planctomonas sp. JC2975]